MYNDSVAINLTGDGKEGSMEVIDGLIISIVADIIAYYICKWLDGKG